MATDVQVPALGESITDGTLAQWLKKPGEQVAEDEPIASLETDKVTVEVPSPSNGILTEQLVKEGDAVAVGAVIARIDVGATAASAPAKEAAVATTNQAGAGETPALRGDEVAPVAEPEVAQREAEEDHITTLSPAVRRAVLEYHVDPTSIRGTGKDGRLTKDDVIAAAEAKGAEPSPAIAPQAKAPSAPPQPAPASQAKAPVPSGERREERVRMSRLRQTVARRLKEAQNTAAMLTTFNDVDMSAVMDARSRYKDLFEKKHGIRLGFMSFFVKACVLAARDVPSVNGSIEGDEIVYRDYFDVSIAVSAPKGLVVPVIRNAQAMSFADIEKTIAEYGKKAKEGTLTVDEMTGGTFTISNGGVFGSLLSTPIINPPQSAVLGMHRIEERPMVVDGQIVGREAVTFLVRVKEAIEDPTRLLIDL